MTVINVDCLEGFSYFPDNSFDSIVCDPPYELGFMGKSWDSTGIAYNVAMWREALRVLKPGGHLLAFSGSRTYHRMTCAIEDAGFDIRDQIMWVYGSGFPKSLDVSKAIDKAAGAKREVIGNTGRDPNRMLKFKEQDGCKRSPTNEDITAPATDAARQWDGWGTALKPAHEPICMARKPLIGTVAGNVLAQGVGALNIDGCRVATDDNLNGGAYAESGGRAVSGSLSNSGMNVAGKTVGTTFEQPAGRWPANFIHDGSDEVIAAFPAAPGQQGATAERQQGQLYNAVSPGEAGIEPRNDTGSAARFFYCAKASKKDREEGLEGLTQRTDSDGALRDGGRESEPRANTHPTVKPTDLMRYLCRLVTPPGGKILDHFSGSGSTGKAAKLEGFIFIGFEMSAEYTEIANRRINAV